jgi:iron transport multicopper oxidase
VLLQVFLFFFFLFSIPHLISFPQVLSGAQSATDLLPSGSVFTLPANSVVELSIPGGTAGAPHPFHLHGVRLPPCALYYALVLTPIQHNFFVIKSAGNDTFNFDNPVCQRYFAACPFTRLRFIFSQIIRDVVNTGPDTTCVPYSASIAASDEFTATTRPSGVCC